MRRRLTDIGVGKLNPMETRYEVADAIVGGLYLVVQPSGARSWAVRARIAGKPAKLTLGAFPQLAVAEARSKARATLDMIAKGIDPREQDRERQREDARRKANTLRVVAEQFRDKQLKKARPRSWKQAWSALDRHVLEDLGDCPVSEITRRELLDTLDVLDGRPAAKRHAADAIGALFAWATDREIVAANPAIKLPKPKPGVRHRALSDDEVRHVWAVCDLVGDYGGYVRMLLLTACRRSELAGLRWSEIDLAARTLTIPAERYKTGRELTVPLSPLAERVLEAMPRWADGDFVFTTTRGRRPISGYSKLGARFDARLEAYCAANGVEPFTFDLHDLRRTVRTGLSELKVAPHIAEFVLGHVVSGVQKHYDKWSYLDEKREALEKWAGKVERLVSPDAAHHNVVSLRRG